MFKAKIGDFRASSRTYQPGEFFYTPLSGSRFFGDPGLFGLYQLPNRSWKTAVGGVVIDLERKNSRKLRDFAYLLAEKGEFLLYDDQGDLSLIVPFLKRGHRMFEEISSRFGVDLSEEIAYWGGFEYLHPVAYEYFYDQRVLVAGGHEIAAGDTLAKMLNYLHGVQHWEYLPESGEVRNQGEGRFLLSEEEKEVSIFCGRT